MAWCCASLKDLDNDHSTAAAWTGRLAGVVDGLSWFTLTIFDGQHLARACDVVDAGAPRQQAVMADAVKAFWQHMDEEAADELEGGECHLLVSIAAFDAVVLPLEGDALFVKGAQAAVGDGNAVGVTRQIGQHGLRSAERSLGVDDPLGFAQRGEIG